MNRGITDAEERRRRKTLSALQGRKAQSAARLLLSLCARAGEGRRRVLAELYWALSCHPREGGRGVTIPRGMDARYDCFLCFIAVVAFGRYGKCGPNCKQYYGFFRWQLFLFSMVVV